MLINQVDSRVDNYSEKKLQKNLIFLNSNRYAFPTHKNVRILIIHACVIAERNIIYLLNTFFNYLLN